MKDLIFKTSLIAGLIVCILIIVDMGKSSQRMYRNYKSSLDSLKIHTTRQGEQIFYQNQIIVGKQSHINDYKYQTDTVYEIRYVGSDNVFDYLRVPSVFSKDSEWLTYRFTVYKDRGVMDSLSFVTKPTITIGYEKEGLLGIFKRNNPVVTITDKNPFANVGSIENVFLEKQPPRLSLGLQAGWYMTSKGLLFGVGAGLGYRIF